MFSARGRRPSPWSCLLFAVLLGIVQAGVTPSTLAAQVSAADSAAVLLETAAAFERDGRWEIAEALYVHITEQFGATPAAREARARLNAPPADRLERASGVELQVFGTTYGLWLGVAVPQALGAQESEAYGAGLLIGGPLGLFGSRAATRARQFSEGQARAITWGGVFGTWQGYGWTELLDFGKEDLFCDAFGCYGSSGGNEEELFAGMVFGGLAGIGVGAMIARNPLRSGVASGAQGGSTWGSIYGAMATVFFDEDGGDAPLASALIVGNVGLLAGGALASKYDVSRSRVRMMNLGALVGLVGGFGVDLLVQPDGDKTIIGIPLAASMLGLGIAIGTTGERDAVGSDPEGDPAGDPAGALFGYRDGRLTVGAPLPTPVLLSVDDVNGRPAWRPGLSLELFRAKF